MLIKQLVVGHHSKISMIFSSFQPSIYINEYEQTISKRERFFIN